MARTLRSAYAVGLLTHDTFTVRITDLYGASRVDPQRLVGDLAFRSDDRRPRRLHAVTEAIGAWRRHLEARQSQLPLLALDWTGATTEMVIGRSSGCDLVLDNPEISRRHAHLFFREERWILLDLESKNGTYINGARVHRVELRPGDVLALANEELQVD